MTKALTDLEPQTVWGHFDQIRRIPRCSGQEEAVRHHLSEVAAARGWSSQVDAVGNLLLRIPARPGHEAAATVVFQGHLDMVCEKNNDVDHDFATTGIDAYIDGELVRARGTSLGADNGIGLALALGLVDDPDAVHGPVEILATVDEETGLTGAANLDASMITGRILLNLDSEEEGEFCVGCAGGGDQAGHFEPARIAPPAGEVYAISVAGLLGGHSGLDIAVGRGNAILVLGRLLLRLIDEGVVSAVDTLAGGSKHNAIPREAIAVVRLGDGQRAAFERILAEQVDREVADIGAADPGLTITAAATTGADMTIGATTLRPLLATLLELPHGMIAMSPDIDGLVQTSNNVAIVSDEDGRLRFYTSSRSSVASELDAVREKIAAILAGAGAKVERDEGYPAWQPNLASPLLARCQEAFTKSQGHAAPVRAVHAGLECGIIGEAVEGMDMISFGPDIRNPHSPDEYVSIPSVARTYDFLRALMKEFTAA